MSLTNGLGLIAFTDANYSLIESLVNEAEQEGFEFVQRTVDDWKSGVNKFSAAGEGMWGLVSGGGLVGIGGLNIDPYVEAADIGRVRHLYIRQAHRRRGCAAFLMNTIIEQARLHFQLLRVFTANPAAAALYEQLGFEHLSGYKVSHVLNFKQRTQ